MKICFEDLVSNRGYVIAETACGHEGELKKIKLLIDCVSESGAQIIKFQIFTPEERATKDHPEWDIFNKLALSEQDWLIAAEYARSKKLHIFADIFGKKSFAIANKLCVEGYKIHSEDLLNSYFIAKIASKKKILMIGIGGAHRIEIRNLIDFLSKNNKLDKIILTTGVQTFPTPIEAHSIEEINDLINKYASERIKIGFSDHISGDKEEAFIVPLMALSRGASIIEKHITVDRKDKWEDYQSALDKKSFKHFMDLVKKLSPLLNPIGKLNEYEDVYRKTFKKTPVAENKLCSGHVLTSEDISYVKSSSESVPISSINIVNKKLTTDIIEGSMLRLSHVTNKIGGIIVARCTSSRLPNKALHKICGRETIALLIERIKRCRNLDCVILATSTDSSDDPLEEIANREQISLYRGSLDNLSLRFYEAARINNINTIVRITGDDILRDETMIDKAVAEHCIKSCDVTFTKDMPYGTSSEIFSFNALETIMKYVEIPENTEYLEYFLENTRYFSIHYVPSGYSFPKELRLTLDYEEDFKLFEDIFKHFYSKNKKFTLSDVLEWISNNPSVVDINKHKTVKFTKKDLKVTLNI